MEQGAKGMNDPELVEEKGSSVQRNQSRYAPVYHGPDVVVHAMRAMTAAPMSPAAPSCAACVDAALLVVAGFVVVVGLPAEDEEGESVPVVAPVRGVVTGLVEVVRGAEEVPLALVAPAVVGEAWPVPEEVEFVPRQLVSEPLLTVNAAEDSVVPVESRIVRPRDVPAVKLATHVTESPLVCGKDTRDWALGWPPGRMLTKYGAWPPVHVSNIGSHSTTLVGVLIVS